MSPRIYGLDRTSDGRRLTPAGKALKLKILAVAIVVVVIGGLALESALLGGEYVSGGTVDLHKPAPVVLEVRKETTGTYVLTMAPKPGKGGKRRSHVLLYSVAGPGRKPVAEGKDKTLTKQIDKLPFECTVEVAGKELPRMKHLKMSVAP